MQNGLIGIDGDQWYVCNDICLAEPNAVYCWGNTLRQAIASWNEKNGMEYIEPTKHDFFLDMTTHQYLRHSGRVQ